MPTWEEITGSDTATDSFAEEGVPVDTSDPEPTPDVDSPDELANEVASDLGGVAEDTAESVTPEAAAKEAGTIARNASEALDSGPLSEAAQDDVESAAAGAADAAPDVVADSTGVDELARGASAAVGEVAEETVNGTLGDDGPTADDVTDTATTVINVAEERSGLLSLAIGAAGLAVGLGVLGSGGD